MKLHTAFCCGVLFLVFIANQMVLCSTACPAGFTPVDGACEPCSAGKYKATAGNSSCHSCAPGTYSHGGASACTDCTAGRLDAAGATECDSDPVLCTCALNSQLEAIGPTWQSDSTLDDLLALELLDRYVFDTDHSMQVMCVLTKPSLGYLLFRCLGSYADTGQVAWIMTPDGSATDKFSDKPDVQFHYKGWTSVVSQPLRYIPNSNGVYDAVALFFRQARLKSTGRFGLLPMFYGASSNQFSFDGSDYYSYRVSEHYFFPYVQVFDIATGAKLALADIPVQSDYEGRFFDKTISDVLWTKPENPTTAYAYSGSELYLMAIEDQVTFTSLELRSGGPRVSYVAISHNLSAALYVKDKSLYCAHVQLQSVEVIGSVSYDHLYTFPEIMNVAFSPNELFAIVQYENMISRISLDSCTVEFLQHKAWSGSDYEPLLHSVSNVNRLLVYTYSQILVTSSFVFVPYWTKLNTSCFGRFTHDLSLTDTQCFQNKNAIAFIEDPFAENSKHNVYATLHTLPSSHFTLLVFDENSMRLHFRYSEPTSNVLTLGVSVRTQALFLAYDDGATKKWPTTCVDTFCKKCSAGAVQSSLWLNSLTQCENCTQGEYRHDDNQSCSACPAGSYAPMAGSSICTLCAQDTFSNVSSATACSKCADAYYAQAPGGTSCQLCAHLIPGGGQDAQLLTPRPSPLAPLFTPDGTAQPHTPRAKISPNQHCLAVLLDHEKIRGGQWRARVLVLGARSGTQSEALTLQGAGTFVDFAVTDAAVHAVFAGADASVASMQLDEYCRPVARTEAQYPTANLSACNGSSVVFAGAEDAYLLLCHAENTSTVAGALALVTGILQPWPNASAGVPRLVQFFKDDGLHTSYAVQYANGAQAQVLTQNSTGAFVHLHALASHDDRDWAYAADAARATTGTAGGELLFLPREYPRVAEFFANGSARAWQLRGCFEYEISWHALFEQKHAHALLFARADCKAMHELVDPAQGCVSAIGAYPTATEFYVHGDLGFLRVATCSTHQQFFPEAQQQLIFNNSSPQRKRCAQSIACEYGSLPAAGDATLCACRAGFAVKAETGGCEACVPGTFSDSTAAPNCTLCPAATPFSHRASTSARSCFAAYGIRTRDPGVLGELRALADAVAPAGDTVAVHEEAAAQAPASMSELRAQLHKQ